MWVSTQAWSVQPPQVQQRTLRSLRNVYCKGDLAAADELFDPNYVDHDPDGPSAARGPECVRRTVAMYRGAIPDLRLGIEEQLVEGDTVVTRWVGRGTHLGKIHDAPPTGERVSLRGVTVMRFSNARAVEGWSNWQEPIAYGRPSRHRRNASTPCDVARAQSRAAPGL